MTRKERQALNRKEYNKQLRRVREYIRYHERKGEIVNIQLPQRPTSYTKKEIQKLAKLTPKRLSKSIVTIDLDTGEIIEKRKKPKKTTKIPQTKKQEKSKKKYEEIPPFTDTGEPENVKISSVPISELDLTTTIIENVLDEVAKFPSNPSKQLITTIENLRKEKGDSVVADIFMNIPSFIETLQKIGHLYNAIDEFTTLIYKQLPISEDEIKQMTEELEENTSWGD